jgi:outer membrane immunogenic protein
MQHGLILLVSVAALTVSAIPSRAATNIDELTARLDRIEAENRRIAGENKMLRARLNHLEGQAIRKPDRQSPLVADAYASLPPAKGAPNPPPYTSRSWTGFYVGAQAGGTGLDSTWSNARFGQSTFTSPGNIPSIFPPFSLQSDNAMFGTGGLAGVHIGYRKQFDRIVVGISDEWSWTNISSRGSCFPNDGTIMNQIVGLGERAGSFNCTANFRNMNSIAGSIGMTNADSSLLFYGRAGAAFSRQQLTLVPATTTVSGAGPRFDVLGFPSTISSNRTGILIGGGLEVAMGSNWSTYVAYDFIDFGQRDEAFSPVLANVSTLWQGSLLLPVNVSVQERLHQLKFGISYQFR